MFYRSKLNLKVYLKSKIIYTILLLLLEEKEKAGPRFFKTFCKKRNKIKKDKKLSISKL